MAMQQNRHFSEWPDDSPSEEGIRGDVHGGGLKRLLSWEVANAMKKEGVSKSEMAKRMRTSRSQLERFLDPENPSVLLQTVQKAAAAVGKRVTIGLVDAPRRHLPNGCQ